MVIPGSVVRLTAADLVVSIFSALTTVELASTVKEKSLSILAK